MTKTNEEIEYQMNWYRGVLAQDGWETVELTIRGENSKEVADYYIKKLEEENL